MPLYNIRNVGVQSTTRRTMDALLNWRTDSTKEQLKKRNGAVRLILNNGKLRGTHAKLMIGSRSCLLKEDIKSAWMETLLKMQWIFQRYIQEKSCLVVGLQHLETQVNQGMEATTNEEQRLNQWRYSKTYFGLELDHFSISFQDRIHTKKVATLETKVGDTKKWNGQKINAKVNGNHP